TTLFRSRRVDRFVTASAVAEIEEQPAKHQYGGDRRERTDHVFAVHPTSAAVGQVLPMWSRRIGQATASTTIASSRRPGYWGVAAVLLRPAATAGTTAATSSGTLSIPSQSPRN